LQHGLGDVDFAGLRGPQVLGRLPKAERQPWQKPWADIIETLVRARGKATVKKKPDAK
jgi:hypothetical protein